MPLEYRICKGKSSWSNSGSKSGSVTWANRKRAIFTERTLSDENVGQRRFADAGGPDDHDMRIRKIILTCK